jgi:hypothetical protein
MKWIGQHIWDFISRFRNDVYLEKVANDTVEGSPDADTTLALKNGKVVRTAGGTGGGSITVKTDGDNSEGTDGEVSTVRSDVTEIIYYGDYDHVRVYDNGAGSVIVDHHNTLEFADVFSISTDPVDDYSPYWIGDPQTGNDGTYGYNFHDGGWGGLNNKKATNAASISFTSNVCGNWLLNDNASKLRVTVYGPDSNDSSDTNVLGTHTLQVTDNTTSPHSQANGITIAVSNYDTDGTPNLKKASVTVTIDLDNSNLIDTSGDYTGSQKYSKIRIEQLDHNDAAISGVDPFESAAFFYDNLHLQPTASTPTFTFGTNTTKQLSNIGYYSAVQHTVDSANHSNLTRDTGFNSKGYVYITLDPSTTTGNLGYANSAASLTGDDGDTDNNNNYQTDKVYTMAANTLKLNFVQGVKLKVYGGIAGYSANSSVVDDVARNYNSYTSSASALSEDHKGEVYRLADSQINTVKSLSTAQTQSENDWKDYCVASNPTDQGVIGLSKNQDHLVQGYFNSQWGLFHPSDVSGLASKPDATELNFPSGMGLWSNSGLTGTYYYYRFFRTTGSATSDWSIDIDGLSKSTFEAQTGNGNLTIEFLAPGNSASQTDGVDNQGTWIPLDTNHSSGNNNGCWANAVNQASSEEQFDLAFNLGTTVLIMKIGMNASFPASTIKALTMQTGHQNS